MKKVLLTTLATAFIIISAQAQSAYYRVKKDSGAYTDLSGAQPYKKFSESGESMVFDTDFRFWDRHFRCSEDYPLEIFTIPTVLINNSENKLVQITGLGATASMTNRDSTSGISTLVSGEPGNRIFKIQYKNGTFAAGDPAKDSFNVQIWIYEKNAQVDFRYGPMNFTAPEEFFENGNAKIGIVLFNRSTVTTEKTLWFVGDPAAPKANYATPLSPLNGLPKPGYIYTLEPTREPTVSVKEQDLAFTDFNLYPQPVQNVLNLNFGLVQSGNVTIQISDLQGRVLRSESLNNRPAGALNWNTDVSELPAGVYTVRVATGNAAEVRKFIKM